MSWIADVAPYTTILSQWGNNIRNRIVQTFDSQSEMNAHAASLPDGSLATLPGDYALYCKRGTFKPTTARGVYGTPVAGVASADIQGQEVKVNSFVIPAGYRSAIFTASVRVNFTGGTTPGSYAGLRAYVYSSGSPIGAGYMDRHYMATQSNGTLDTLNVAFAGYINPNGDSAQLNTFFFGNPSGGFSFAADQSNQFQAILFP